MDSKDSGQLTHYPIPLIWICRVPFISSLQLNLVQIHLERSQSQYSEPFQWRSFIQNMYRVPCIRRSLLSFSFAALAVNECTRLVVHWQSAVFPVQFIMFGIFVDWSFQNIVRVVKYLSQTFHIDYFHFRFKTGCGKIFEPVNPVFIHSFTNLSMVPSRTSKDFVLLDAKTLVGARPSIQIICFLTNFFWGTLIWSWFTSFPIPSAKASVSCSSLNFCFIFFFLQSA